MVIAAWIAGAFILTLFACLVVIAVISTIEIVHEYQDKASERARRARTTK